MASYPSDPKNSFFSLEDDVNDETLLRNAPTRTGRYHGFDDIDQNRQQLLQRQKKIEERTVQSSKRSVSLLRDSEQIGVATAEKLIRQKEQLEKTEERLDDINNTLKVSQKHIQGIKSAFGSLKNYLSGKLLNAPPIPSIKLSESSNSGSSALFNTLEQMQNDMSNSYSSTMIRRNYDDNSLKDVKPSNDRMTKVFDENLSEMSESLARLKHLAIGLTEEIKSQNDLIDNITDKTEKADTTLQQQNKDMLDLL
ncbi:synaptosomal-associated protein 29-like [Solenopsis invicta]|uniref:synaptosomal-associated protein 29-like n=1 Tax=Solenopsis invicta TaxID=13686 RepID=UPI000E34010A|nr:synaptosomal-associated protein 29-like [Solenopsis invicta]